MKIIDLSEGISPIVFHITSLVGAGRIVSEDRFRLTASFANDSEQSVGSTKQFFLSVTRSKTGGYTLRNTGNGSTVFVLDGQKLSNNYKGGPVQYWSRGMIDIDSKYDEMEDRIYHDDPFIPNATSYIQEAHVFIKNDDLHVQGRNGLALLKKKRIPTFIYDDENAFVTQNKAKAKPLSQFTLPKEEPEKRWPSLDSRASYKQRDRRDRQAGNKPKLNYGTSRWIELLAAPTSSYNSMHYSKRDFIQSLVRAPLMNKSVLSSDLHNAKNDPKEIGPIAKLMKKHGLRTADDILEFLSKKWQKAAGY